MDVAAAKSHVDRAARLAALDLARCEQVEAVCVIGSSARGDSTQRSDIDLLALVADRPTAQAAAVRARRQHERAGRRVQPRLLSAARLTRLLDERSTFAVHVLREAVVIDDPAGKLAAICGAHDRDAPVRDPNAARDLRLRLEPYADLAWCEGVYLYCLSDLYSIARAAAFTILGRAARFEFSGSRAFATVARHVPDLAPSARRAARLRPFYLLAERDASGPPPPPFQHRDCHSEAERARDACATLVEAVA